MRTGLFLPPSLAIKARSVLTLRSHDIIITPVRSSGGAAAEKKGERGVQQRRRPLPVPWEE